ncbi:helix-turn-helix transcriptional regulator [Paenibacillus cymbidii]|uniref:helix-turn-helix transcriptional regulator n=1 Tax=Paenibacillus cymbidii TaxID=1639034 RepID=UPI001081DB9E|nr:AraC family transcriptional regulator [Paenibacillus cymbidii]
MWMFIIEQAARKTAFSMMRNHFHDVYEVYYLLSGERHYFIKDRTYRIAAGTFVFIDRYELHRTMNADKPEHDRYLIQFSDDVLQSFGTEAAERLRQPFRAVNRAAVVPEGERARTEAQLQEMLAEYESGAADAELAIRGLLVRLLLQQARRMERGAGEAAGQFVGGGKISAIVRYIGEHYGETITLSGVAGHFYLNASYVSRMFKQTTGFTFSEYVNHLRIVEAQRLLRETGDNVIRVAERVGFDSIAHFGRVFKQIVGASPLQYRKTAERPGPM